MLSLVLVACGTELPEESEWEGESRIGNFEDEEEEDFPWSAAPDLPYEPPQMCEPGSYNCYCKDPYFWCDEGYSCIGGKCTCDFLGTIHCPCNLDTCDDGLSCNVYGFCEP